jgi:Arc/MetJ family transcription regulator
MERMHQVMYVRCIPQPAKRPVRTTLDLDESLLEAAHRLTGMRERTALIHEGLRALIERESARRLTRLGGTAPDLDRIPRRRPGTA